VHRIPARGAKFKLNMTRVRWGSDQFVSSDSAIVPITNSVFEKALAPTKIINPIKNTMKITPIEPTFMKTDKSFFEHKYTNTGNSTKAQ